MNAPEISHPYLVSAKNVGKKSRFYHEEGGHYKIKIHRNFINNILSFYHNQLKKYLEKINWHKIILFSNPL